MYNAQSAIHGTGNHGRLQQTVRCTLMSEWFFGPDDHKGAFSLAWPSREGFLLPRSASSSDA